MNRNYIFDTATEALPELLSDLLKYGDEVGSRAGRTRELMHVGTTLRKPWQREILVPGRRPNLAAQIAETMWVLAGRSDVAWLAHYLPRSPDFSDDGITWRAAYGARLREWNGVDQIAYVVRTLQQHALTRQAVATIWDPTIDDKPGKDIPCNNWLSFSNRLGKLDLHVAIRSNDIVWGWSGINAFEWSALQEIVAHLVGVKVGSLHFSTTSLHLYEHHWDRAGAMVQNAPQDAPLQDSPRFDLRAGNLADLDHLVARWMNIEYQIRSAYHNHQDIEEFPEPMLRSWLRVIEWWWDNDWNALEPLAGTRLYKAAEMSVQPSERSPMPVIYENGLATGPIAAEELVEVHDQSLIFEALKREHNIPADFIAAVDKLHRAKHADYGDSWKRRGEAGILGNIARKVDRLGKNSDHESALDTAIDLLVYLCKYRWWLVDEDRMESPVTVFVGNLRGVGQGYSDRTEPVLTLLHKLAGEFKEEPERQYQDALTEMFRQLEEGSSINANTLLRQMTRDAFSLAYQLWSS